MALPADNAVASGRALAFGASARRPGKSAGAFRTISEVATDLDVPQHVLRFWETRFVQIRPLKRAGGRRYYRPEDVELLRRIRELLYNNGYTIKGVQRLLRDNGRRPDEQDLAEPADALAEGGDEEIAVSLEAGESRAAAGSKTKPALENAVNELLSIRDLLRKARR
jgi:DNA-binding transcriptional MerR regulator